MADVHGLSADVRLATLNFDMGNPPPPPVVLFLLGAVGAARAAIETLANKGKRQPPPGRSQHVATRTFTPAELSPLIMAPADFVREPSTLQHTLKAIAVESANELVESAGEALGRLQDRLSAVQALSACPVSFADAGFALSAGKSLIALYN